jgi:hypothetical protein
MNYRKLLDGSLAENLDQSVTLTVKTKCPSKYKLIYLETGQTYIGYNTEGKHSWQPIEKIHEDS